MVYKITFIDQDQETVAIVMVTIATKLPIDNSPETQSYIAAALAETLNINPYTHGCLMEVEELINGR